MSEGERAGPTWRPAWWPFGRGRSEPSSVVPAPPVAVSPPVAPEGAWRDLPAIQRTLSDPLRPVAMGDEFRQSLASFTDPSFVAPLSHQVDPSTGGLVDGLASPGRPYAHPGVADLPVPPRPAAPAPPRVQRSVAAWSGSADLSTVSWELPGAAAEAEPPASEAPPLTSDLVEPTVAASVPAGPGPVSAPALITAQRSLAAVPVRPGPTGLRPPVAHGELPVVAGSAVSTAPARSPSADPPVVSRVPDTAAESAPLSGFAAAITTLARADDEPAGPEDGPASASDGDDRPVAGSPLQRLAADAAPLPGAAPLPAAAPEPAAGASDESLSGLPVLSTLDQGATGSPSSTGYSTEGSLPVVARVLSPAGEGPPSPPSGDRAPSLTGAAPAARPVDAPTLGPRLAQAPLAVPGAPLIARLASSAEPAVQRVEFLTPPVGTVRPTPPAGAPVSEAAPVAFDRPRTETADRPSPTSFSSPPSTPLPAAPQVQRVWEPAVPAPVVRSPAADAGSDTAWVEEPAFATALTDQPSSPVDLRDRSEPTGPAVAAEPWTPIPSISVALPPGPAASPAAASPTAAAYTAQRVASSPMVTVGPSIPVQRSAAHANEAAAETPSTAAPMAVSRQVAGALPPGAARSGGAVSFASMFGSVGAMPPAESGATADDGFSSVQREPADAAPPASEPAAEPAASAPISSAAPTPAGAAAAPTDLDEMARRLYEPLSARLRAEFWLDRERAGVMSDV